MEHTKVFNLLLIISESEKLRLMERNWCCLKDPNFESQKFRIFAGEAHNTDEFEIIRFKSDCTSNTKIEYKSLPGNTCLSERNSSQIRFNSFVLIASFQQFHSNSLHSDSHYFNSFVSIVSIENRHSKAALSLRFRVLRDGIR